MQIIERKKILFINQAQFGYHIDYVQYCKYLKDDFDITYICWDYNRNIIYEPDINVLYISRAGNIFKRNLRFISEAIKCIKQQNYSLVFIHYFRGSSLISILGDNKNILHIDIRTGSVSPNIIKRTIDNSILWLESIFFKSQSIISIGLRNKLRISKGAYILPLGANPIQINRKKKNSPHLLYVGTLSGRRIEETIKGMKIFIKEQPKTNIHYTIVGDGWQNEKQNLQNIINELELQEHIELTGYVPNNEIVRFYEIANIGVSYIPITPYYEYQPATKTYEYLMAGMPVIATETYENKQVINTLNGVLIRDTPTDFAKGIAELYKNSSYFDENTIKKTVENYDWKRIVQTMKETILKTKII